MLKRIVVSGMLMVLVAACNVSVESGSSTGNNPNSSNNTNTTNNDNTESNNNNSNDNNTSADGETGRVTRVIDGDTIDVNINGETLRVRYVGVNTPERDEACYSDATAANSRLVDGQIVRLVKDTSNTDRYDRLLRYVYVGDTFVNQALVEAGYAEAVLYEPDDEYHNAFLQLERAAIRDQRGCHPTGIFDDGSTTR